MASSASDTCAARGSGDTGRSLHELVQGVAVELDAEPGPGGIASRPSANTISSTVSSLRSRDSHSSAGRNSKNGMCGVTVARWAATATEMPVFHACGTTLSPASAAMSHTRRASVRPAHPADVGLYHVHRRALDQLPELVPGGEPLTAGDRHR